MEFALNQKNDLKNVVSLLSQDSNQQRNWTNFWKIILNLSNDNFKVTFLRKSCQTVQNYKKGQKIYSHLFRISNVLNKNSIFPFHPITPPRDFQEPFAMWALLTSSAFKSFPWMMIISWFMWVQYLLHNNPL